MFFKKKKKKVTALDVGSSSIKLLELDCRGSKPRLLNASITALPGNAFLNNAISNKDLVIEKVHSLFSSRNFDEIGISIAMPAPSVFTKKITLPPMDDKELKSTIEFEAGSYIPHGLDAVRMDYCVTRTKENGELEVLLVAVKNEIVDSFLQVLAGSNLEPAVVDVDYFALQNAFESAYPELIEKTVALVNIGSRYSFVNICKDGDSLFTGNISLGGLELTHEIARTLGIELSDAESLKMGLTDGDFDEKLTELVVKNRSALVSELDRQIRLMWNASGADDEIDQILLSGGGAQLPGLSQDLISKAGIAAEVMDPLRNVEIPEDFDLDYISKLSSTMAIAYGLALRERGDRGATVQEGTVA